MLEGRPDIIRRLIQDLKETRKELRVLEVYRCRAHRCAGAERGEILVSAATAERIQDYFVLENVGERTLKMSPRPCVSFAWSCRDCISARSGTRNRPSPGRITV